MVRFALTITPIGQHRCRRCVVDVIVTSVQLVEVTLFVYPRRSRACKLRNSNVKSAIHTLHEVTHNQETGTVESVRAMDPDGRQRILRYEIMTNRNKRLRLFHRRRFSVTSTLQLQVFAVFFFDVFPVVKPGCVC